MKVSGLRWLSLSVLTEVPWAARVWALRFLTVLCPSARYYARRHRAPKKLTDHARQAIVQVARWLPEPQLVVVADTGFSAIQLLATVGQTVGTHVAIVTRLRLDAPLYDAALYDAALYDAPPPRQPRQKGRPRKRGTRQTHSQPGCSIRRPRGSAWW